MKSNKHKKTLTIGIAAHNEEKTLTRLLGDIERQSLKPTVKLEKIIIVSDGSTDKTCDVARSYKSLPIKLVERKTQRGKAYGLGQIFAQATSDVLIIFDADIRIKQANMLEAALEQMGKNKADLLAIRVQYERPKSVLQRVLAASCDMKETLFESLDDGNNIYTCHGRARAFSKHFYKKLIFKQGVSEDAYSYIACVEGKFSYRYTNKARVFYQLPNSVSDHASQSHRFYRSAKNRKKLQSSNYKHFYDIPIKNVLLANLKTLVKKPELLGYYGLSLYLVNKDREPHASAHVWETVTSTKL